MKFKQCGNITKVVIYKSTNAFDKQLKSPG